MIFLEKNLANKQKNNVFFQQEMENILSPIQFLWGLWVFLDL